MVVAAQDPSTGAAGPPAKAPRVGGLLLLAGLQLIAVPVLVLYSALELPAVVERFASMTSWQQVLVIGTPLVTVALGMIAPIYLLVLLFQRRAKFPALYSIWILVVALWSMVSLALQELAFGGVNTNAAIAAYSVLLWVPYMRNSKRVKKTFVN